MWARAQNEKRSIRVRLAIKQGLHYRESEPLLLPAQVKSSELDLVFNLSVLGEGTRKTQVVSWYPSLPKHDDMYLESHAVRDLYDMRLEISVPRENFPNFGTSKMMVPLGQVGQDIFFCVIILPCREQSESKIDLDSTESEGTFWPDT